MEWADVPAKEVRDEKTGFRATYEYTKTGDLKKVDTPMLHTTYAYDGDRNLTALRTTASMEGMEKLLADNVYRYNKNGQRTEKTTLAGTTKYTYDVLGQLIQENNHIYTYDRAGNRTSVQTDDRREIYYYDRGRLTTRTVERAQDPAGKTYTYRYDAQGNTLSDGENTYLYDCLNRIAEVQTKAGDIQKNHYDAEGLRSQMEENGKLVSFIYADREVIAEEDEAGEHIRYIRGHELLASDSERARTYYHYACDELGSITDITDCHGTVLNHYAYDAFGNRTVEEETVENRFGFAGEILDAVTGQYYLRARFYNPVIARFLSEDTYYGDGLNLYAYCHNNPVRYVDPSGHICEKKYQELKKKEAGGGTLSEKERQQIYEYEQNQKKSNGTGSDSKSGAYSGDLMSAEEAARYSEHWRELGIGSDKTYNDFIMNNPGKNIDDYFRLVKEQSPWPDEYMPSEHMVTLKSGDTFNMVLDSKQKTSNPGGFALKEDVPSVEFARKDMAIKYAWKDDCGKVATYRVKDGVELICPAGPIGPQIDLGVDMYLPGNSSLTQYDLFNGLGRINRMDFIEVVPGSIRRIK